MNYSSLEIERYHVGYNRVESSTPFNQIRSCSILHTLYTLARIECDRSPSNYIPKEANRMTSNDINNYLSEQEKRPLNVEFRQAQVAVEREWHPSQRECDLTRGCDWNRNQELEQAVLVNAKMTLVWDAGARCGRGKGEGGRRGDISNISNRKRFVSHQSRDQETGTVSLRSRLATHGHRLGRACCGGFLKRIQMSLHANLMKRYSQCSFGPSQ